MLLSLSLFSLSARARESRDSSSEERARERTSRNDERKRERKQAEESTRGKKEVGRG